MKPQILLVLLILFAGCVNGKDRYFTGSTPAGPVTREFLGIDLNDSIDFIRWKLTFNDLHYVLECNYGIGKPNTNGFINGGKTVRLEGAVKFEKNYYMLHNKKKILNLAEINNDLLYLLNDQKELLIGNGGWSYALNNQQPTGTSVVNIYSTTTGVADSMIFVGRTPCRGLDDERDECYKRKWLIVFYADDQAKKPGRFHMNGTGPNRTGGTWGTWSILPTKTGAILFELKNGKNNKPLYLLKVNENILHFTDPSGKPLIGDHDFSYSLNKRQ
jgi:hypothetical protein